jgi:5-methylcytosine-specific restriction protein A
VVQPFGLKPSAIPLTMICGAPGSGKSTYIEKHRGENDILIDIDAILQDLSGDVVRTQERRDRYLLDAFMERNRRLSALADETRPIAAWFIIGAPKPSMREAWAKQLSPVAVVVMETAPHVCIERINAAPQRAPTARGMVNGVRTWWDRYERSDIDTLRLVV